MTAKTIVDVHILQTVPPSNINRDDTGSPKTAIYGGVQRARVSSQSWKRATRGAFDDILDQSRLGVRTKKVVEVIAAAIVEREPELEDRAQELAVSVLKAANIATEKPSSRNQEEDDQAPEARYLIFLARRQIENLADLAIEAERSGGAVEKAAAKTAADSNHSVDVALFGRMVAEAVDLNVDAAAQVAHAISVHAVDTEFDYFTAVDDRAPEDNAGAGMIGTVEFNSSTLYRYATVNVNGLRTSLGTAEAAAVAVGAFLRAFITSMPTGKQNTFANRTLPDAVLVTVRDSQPVNLVGAFEDPVVTRVGTTRVGEASDRLASYAAEVDAAYGQKPVAGFVVSIGAATKPLAGLGESVTLDGLVDSVERLVGERLQED